MNAHLEIPVCLAGGEKEEEKVVTGRILPAEIAFYYPGYHWGSVVILKSGYSVLTTLTPEEIDQAILSYRILIAKGGSLKGNLALNTNKQ
jgi:hypothetical protein